MYLRLTLLLALGLSPLLAMAANHWQPVENAMLTRWGEQVTPDNAWREYPRPQMVRPEWTNLNGLWDYAVTPRNGRQPQEWDRQILVPFALETPLSGVGRRLGEDEVLWYHRNFEWKGPVKGRVLLHFEGVDYACQVWVNGTQVGSHRGGNLPFSFDATGAIQPGANELVLRVIDETDAVDRYQLRGKQRRDNSGIWYTPSSGIWQTVWLGPVPDTYIERIRAVAGMDGSLALETFAGGAVSGGETVQVQVIDQDRVIAEGGGPLGQWSMEAGAVELWSPEKPRLYRLAVSLLDARGKVLDEVESYAGFRTVGRSRDEAGHWRITLNGEQLFQYGPLDQGWWPDGFLNPPADEAMVFELEFLKAAGFNMLRKHKKVEPRRYYYHADRLGILVWQDQVAGGVGPNEWPKWQKLAMLDDSYVPDESRPNAWRPGDPVDADWPDWAHEQYMAELKGMIDDLFNHPSVILWTPFNERWGQHRSMEVGRFVEEYDPTRLLNIASGGNFFPVGDVADEHHYPDPAFPLNVSLFDNYIKVVGEFGGHGFPVEGHLWDTEKDNWGYGGLPENLEAYRQRYERTARELGLLRKAGIAAGVYTQTTDVEGEINGLMTYDREFLKLSADELHRIHEEAGLLP